MNRRMLLATAGITVTSTLAGCTGSSSQPNAYTQAPDGNEIRKQISQLLLSEDQLGPDWNKAPRPRESETEFEKHVDGNLHVVNSRAWIYGTIQRGQEKYADKVSEFDGSTSTVDLAVEAIRYTVSGKVEILFRDANAIGRLKYQYLPESESESLNTNVAMTYAELFYENFR